MNVVDTFSPGHILSWVFWRCGDRWRGACCRRKRSTQGWHASTNDWNVQIEKDLHRTFPGHPLMDRRGRAALRRILAAYSRRNDSVGYCQVDVMPSRTLPSCEATFPRC